MMLRGHSLELRYPEATDAEQLLAWENLQEAVLVSEHGGGLTLTEIQTYISDIRDVYLDQQLRWIISLSGSDIGTVDIFDVNFKTSHAQLGILIASEEDRRSGRGKEALSLVLNYCQDVLGLKTIEVEIQENNAPSIRFFENSGFVQKGKTNRVLQFAIELIKI